MRMEALIHTEDFFSFPTNVQSYTIIAKTKFDTVLNLCTGYSNHGRDRLLPIFDSIGYQIIKYAVQISFHGNDFWCQCEIGRNSGILLFYQMVYSIEYGIDKGI